MNIFLIRNSILIILFLFLKFGKIKSNKKQLINMILNYSHLIILKKLFLSLINLIYFLMKEYVNINIIIFLDVNNEKYSHNIK